MTSPEMAEQPEMTAEQKAAAWDQHVAGQAAEAAVPRPYAGPAGGGQLSAPLAPPPPPEPPKTVETPHLDESFTAGDLARYHYIHPADKPGVTRTQVVMVTHEDEHHVHGFVVGELRDLASFLKGELTRRG